MASLVERDDPEAGARQTRGYQIPDVRGRGETMEQEGSGILAGPLAHVDADALGPHPPLLRLLLGHVAEGTCERRILAPETDRGGSECTGPSAA